MAADKQIDTFVLEELSYIDQPPSWLLRSGTGVIALVVIIVLGMSYFIQYPDKIKGKGFLTSQSPPIKLVSQSEGYIKNVLKENGEYVNVGDTILELQTTTNVYEIRKFMDWIQTYESTPLIYVMDLKIPEDLQLGTMQGDYGQIMVTYAELQMHLRNGISVEQEKNIENEILKIHQLIKVQEQEREIYQKDLVLEEKQFYRTTQLKSQGVLSTQDLELAESKLLQKQRQIGSIENSKIQNLIRIEQLGLEKLKINSERSLKTENLLARIHESIVRVKAGIEDWTQKHLIIALKSGTLSYTSPLNSSRYISNQEIIGHIVPTDKGNNLFRMEIPLQNAGKVEKGQKVLIKLDAYPYKEFGLLVSSVSMIGALPTPDAQGNYLYEILIPMEDSLTTDVGTNIPYRPDMTAQINIITEERSILTRIFHQILTLIKRQTL